MPSQIATIVSSLISNYKKLDPRSTKHKNYDNLNGVQLPLQPESTQIPIHNNIGQVDQRREMPRQGYISSGTDSKGSGNIKIHQEIDQDISIKTSYQQNNDKNEDRNALSQDCAIEIGHISKFNHFL